MKFYLVTLLTNTQEQDVPSIAVYSELEKAQVQYHNKLASFHNAEDVLYAVVEILDEYGRVIGLMAILKEAGFDKVGLKTEPKMINRKK